MNTPPEVDGPVFTSEDDWDEMLALISGEWRFVRQVAALMPDGLIVEDFEFPGRLFTVVSTNCRRGAKPKPEDRGGWRNL